jgi:triacylglycerol esterase/lipase EstA (alpha/beta hydrolase family)
MGRRLFTAALVTLCLLGGGVIAAAPAQARAVYPINWDFPSSFLWGLVFPNTPPPGADVPGCRPAPGRRLPVILVNGTGANESDNWRAMAPSLANAGFCVFAFNYGGLSWSGPLTAFGDIPTSAQQLGDFVQAVLAETGARRVDLVGHSQGGMMPRYYLNFLGGARYVDRLVGVVPSNHGTTLGGLTDMVAQFPGGEQLLDDLLSPIPAAVQQLVGSSFMQKLGSVPDSVPGVRYTVITTTHDEVVTPYTSALLSGRDVTNIVVQDQCPDDPVGHIGMVYDPYVVQLTINALDPARAQPAACAQGFTS